MSYVEVIDGDYAIKTDWTYKQAAEGLLWLADVAKQEKNNIHLYDWFFSNLDWLERVKRRMRAYTHRDVKSDFPVCSPKNYGDEYLHRVKVPEEIDTVEEAEQWFYDELYVEYRPTYYDCTGQHFNSFQYAGWLNGSLWVWVWECTDV